MVIDQMRLDAVSDHFLNRSKLQSPRLLINESSKGELSVGIETNENQCCICYEDVNNLNIDESKENNKKLIFRCSEDRCSAIVCNNCMQMEHEVNNNSPQFKCPLCRKIHEISYDIQFHGEITFNKDLAKFIGILIIKYLYTIAKLSMLTYLAFQDILRVRDHNLWWTLIIFYVSLVFIGLQLSIFEALPLITLRGGYKKFKYFFTIIGIPICNFEYGFTNINNASGISSIFNFRMYLCDCRSINDTLRDEEINNNYNKLLAQVYSDGIFSYILLVNTMTYFLTRLSHPGLKINTGWAIIIIFFLIKAILLSFLFVFVVIYKFIKCLKKHFMSINEPIPIMSFQIAPHSFNNIDEENQIQEEQNSRSEQLISDSYENGEIYDTSDTSINQQISEYSDEDFTESV